MRTTIAILTILLISCSQRENKSIINYTNNWKSPVVIGGLPETEKKLSANEMRVAKSNLAFVGNQLDSVRIKLTDSTFYESFLDFEEYTDSLVCKVGLKVIVDLEQILTLDLEDYSFPPPPVILDTNDYEIDSIKTKEIYTEWNTRPRNYIQALSVFILNPTNDTIYLDQQDGRVFMLQEAKDENGNWKPIEYWRYSWCGNSYGASGLSPNNFAVVKMINYSGDFETELRIKLKNGKEIIYSTPFKGAVNKRQFDLPKDFKETRLGERLEEEEYLDKIFLNK